MSTVSITDMVGATAAIHISDSSPLATAQLLSLTTAKNLIKDFDKPVDQPVDQSDADKAAFGAQLTSPTLPLSGTKSLTIKGGVNSELTIATTADGTLFPSDNVSPVIPITANQCWVGFELDTTISAKPGASAGGFGVSVQVGTEAALTVYTLFTGAPLPLLKDALAKAVENFSMATSAEELRKLPLGLVQVRDTSGSVSVKGSYSVPLSLNPLASADLPLNVQLQLAPAATAMISGTLSLIGDLVVRAYKPAENLLSIGIYKEKGTTFAVSLTTGGGIELDSGSTDLLGAVLNAALPGVDVKNSGIPADEAGALNKVIADALDRSLAISLNATCSASKTDEAAVLYEVRLDQGDAAATDAALNEALAGDWTKLGILPNAHRLRDVLIETKEIQHKFALNLFGLYSAASLTQYVQSCTILTDETGQISLIDKAQASRIRAATTPYAADPDKLRAALTQDLIATASYTLLGTKLSLKLSLVQHYLRYAAKMNRQSLRDELLLGYALGVIPAGSVDTLLGQGANFGHVRLSTTVSYETPDVFSLFFSDVVHRGTDIVPRTPRTAAELEQIGRKTMVALLDPADQTQLSQARIRILNDDAAWKAMNEVDVPIQFGTLPELANSYSPAEIHAAGSDWVSIRWWSDSVSKVAPVLASTLAALEAVPDAKNPTTDENFMKQRKQLSSILGDVARNSKSALVGGWGEAVIFALSGSHGAASMDVAWDSMTKHFGA